MSSDWREVSVGDLGRIVTGKTPQTAIVENYGGLIPFLTPSDNMGVKHVESTAKNLTARGLSEVKNCLLPPHSICVSCIGSDLGKVVMTTRETVTNQQINSIIPAKNVDADFVYYAMTILGKELNYISKTSTAVPIVNKSSFSSYTISLPDFEEQRAISSVLSALDARIANNTKINHHLEQMAQAIFKSWFVDFKPWGGVMPDDWREGRLGDIIELFDFKRVPLSSNQRDKMAKIYPYYGAATLMDYVDDYLFDGIYLLLGEDGTVIDDLGFPTLQYVWGKFWVNNHAHILQGRNGFTVESLYTLLKQTSVISIVTGAVQPKINQANLKALGVVIPSEEEMQEFNTLIDPLFAQIRENSDENLRLAETRDSLLPRLMSGELSVTNLDNSQ